MAALFIVSASVQFNDRGTFFSPDSSQIHKDMLYFSEYSPHQFSNPTKVGPTVSTLVWILFSFSPICLGWLAWILLYTSAAYVNLTSCIKRLPLKWAAGISKLTGFHAQFLLSQVMLDDNFHGKAGLWSLDMREKLVREKLGCILVIISMILQTSAIELFRRDPSKRMNMQVSPSIRNGKLFSSSRFCDITKAKPH